MEAQGLSCWLYSGAVVTTIQNPTKQLFLNLHPSTPYYVCFKTLQPFPPRIKSSLKRFDCVSTSEVSNWEDYNKPEVKKKKLAVFVSGGGSNFKTIHDSCIQGSIHGDIVVVVTDKHGCGGAEYARSNKMPVLLFPRTKDNSIELSPTDLVSALRDLEVDFVLLAGYLKLIPTELIRTFPKCILNIHPALLPAFGGKGYYGMKVHKAVIASGARYSGPTIHFVDEHYDTGHILAQRVVPVLANDTPEELAARVLREEHRLYVDVVMALCEERIIWREDGVPFIRSRENPEAYT
ncbi:Phosphoribosylglycinamide formyltransferase chloroplastic [Euphorbia peplus]|nr:Phosphoribosylglycinamide formyltransferase chloroplastic [Euphorbia peplus]